MNKNNYLINIIFLYTPLVGVLPRNELNYKSISIKEKIAWNKNNSLFKDWRPDHEVLLQIFY